MRLKIAFRNVLRNRRRTLLNVCMIAGGVSALILFNSFVLSVVNGLRDITIKTQTGHLQVATPLYWSRAAKSPKDSLLEDAARIQKRITKHPQVKSASGRLTFFGLISKGDQSTSVQGMSFDPAAEGNVSRSFHFDKGRPFQSGKAYEVAVGSSLAKQVDVRVGDNVTILANTFDGVVNAIDLEVVGIFTTTVAAIDERTVLLPLKTAQKLLDTDKVEQIIVNLKDTAQTDSVFAFLQKELPKSLEPRTWYTVSKMYQQVEDFNRVQNSVLEVIILSLILLGILNTIGMSVFERTGEIGTIAALGESASAIWGQFILEGAILGLLGSIAGVITGALLLQLVNYLRIALVIPGASQAITIELRFFWIPFINAGILSILAGTLAAIFPAYRASRMNIANALRHNI
jgi:putative ABC transport system permease protein